MRKLQGYLYYLLFFVTPFIMYSGTSELFEFNKMIFIYIVTSAILCVWTARMIQKGSVSIHRSPFDIFIFLFYGSQILSTLFSIDMHTSIFGYYGRFNGGLLSLTAYLVLYYSFITFIHEEKSEIRSFIDNILTVSVLSSSLVVLWGIPGKLGHDLSCLVFSGKFDNTCWTAQFDPAARMFSTLGQPNWMGAYVAITFFITLYLFLTKKEKAWLYLIVLLLNMMAVFFSNSRSAFVSVAIALIVLSSIFFLKRKSLSIEKLPMKLSLIGMFFLCGVIFLKTGISQIDRYTDPQYYLSQFNKPVVKTTSINKSVQQVPLKISESLDIRRIVWKGAMALGLQYPLFGTGVETFAYSYYFVRPADHNLTSEWDYLYNKAHNEYLNFFATTGMVGLGSYLTFICSVLILVAWWNFKQFSLLQFCLLASWITILITNFIGFSTTVINLYFYLIPALIYVLQQSKNSHTLESTHKKQTHKTEENSHVLWYGVTILFFIFSFQYFVSYWIADVTYAQGENLAKSGDYQTAVELISKAHQLHPEHVYTDKLSFYFANLAIYQKDLKSVQSFIALAEDYNNQSLRDSPENILYWKTRIKNKYIFYQITLDKKYINEGIEALVKSEKISPTDPKLPYFEATYFAVLHDEEKNPTIQKQYQDRSLRAIARSILLKNDYFDSYFLEAQLFKKYKMKKEAKNALEYILINISPNNKQVQDELQSI